MLRSSLYNIVKIRSLSDRESDFENAATNLSCVDYLYTATALLLGIGSASNLICVPEREIMKKAGLRGPGFPCW